MTYMDTKSFSEVLQDKYEALKQVNEALMNRQINIIDALMQVRNINGYYNDILRAKI